MCFVSWASRWLSTRPSCCDGGRCGFMRATQRRSLAGPSPVSPPDSLASAVRFAARFCWPLNCLGPSTWPPRGDRAGHRYHSIDGISARWRVAALRSGRGSHHDGSNLTGRSAIGQGVRRARISVGISVCRGRVPAACWHQTRPVSLAAISSALSTFSQRNGPSCTTRDGPLDDSLKPETTARRSVAGYPPNPSWLPIPHWQRRDCGRSRSSRGPTAGNSRPRPAPPLSPECFRD